ncbi:MAG: hemin-degrading factor [Rhodocyclaceae bacterium]
MNASLTESVVSGSEPPEQLRRRYRDMVVSGARLRARDAAAALGVSEGELLAAHVGETAHRLTPDFEAILGAVGELGRVMALTRNEQCVHERKGVYRNLSFSGGIGLAVDKDIDLRLFMSRWAHAFAVIEPRGDGVARSLQFFDARGEAIHKIHLLEDSDVAAFERLVARFAAPVQQAGMAVSSREPDPAEPFDPPDGFDAAAFRADWDALRDTHDFFAMLKRHQVSRPAAFRQAGEARAMRLDVRAHRRVFEAARDRALPIMVFVGNPGCIQIHTGPVVNIKQLDDWFNVLDPEFNLHLRESALGEAWLVRKPTADGVVTSVEVFDTEGRTVMYLFGARKPGQPENLAWRAIAEGLAAAGVAA